MRHLIELSRYLSIKRKSDDIQNSQQKIQNIVKITLEGGGYSYLPICQKHFCQNLVGGGGVSTNLENVYKSVFFSDGTPQLKY